MKSFAKFISEEREWWDKDKFGEVQHNKIVGNHQVSLSYSKLGNSYMPEMKVNGRTDTRYGAVSDHHKAKIFDFARKSVGDFIQKHKPQEMHVQGNTSQKSKLFRSHVERIAKKHGGEYAGNGGFKFK